MATLRIPIDLTWSGATGSPGVNVWHARTESTIGEPEDVDALAGYLEDFYTAIANVYPSTVTIAFGGEATGVGDDSETIFPAPAWSVTGTGAAAFAPPVLAMYVNWRAATGGRNGRGRTFLGPHNAVIAEGNGTPTEDYRTLVQGAVDALVAESQNSLNGALGVYSRAENIFRDFSSGAVPNKFAVLRSRRD